MVDREGPRGLDVSVAHSARVYDYWLGGKDNFEPDRLVAQKVTELVPMTPASARANRAFLHRAAGFVAREGIHQFLDLGAGLPTVDNTHSVVQKIDPNNRVVYVDYDPIVLVHARALLEGIGPTNVVQADIRDPESVMNHPEVRAVIDFDQPLCVLAVAVMHFFDESQHPYELVARIRDALPSGSYFVLSHLTGEGTAEAGAVLDVMRRGMADPPTVRGHADVVRFFDGYELLEPGVVPVPLWRPDPPVPQQTRWEKPGDPTDDYWIYAGVGRKA